MKKMLLIALLALAPMNAKADAVENAVAFTVGAGSAWLLDAKLPAMSPTKRHWLITAGSVAVGMIYEAARSHGEHDFSTANAFTSTLGTLTIATIRF